MVCLTTFGLATNKASAQTCYRLIDLGEIGTSAAAEGPFGINESGVAAYAKEVNDKVHAFVSVLAPTVAPIGGGCHDLHILSGLDPNEESGAHDINKFDVAVGWATFSGERHAVVWRIDQFDPNETPPIPVIDLGVLTVDSSFSEAYAINNDEPEPVIVGTTNIFEKCDCSGGGNNLVNTSFWRTLTDPPQGLGSAIRLVHAGDPCLPDITTTDANSDLGAENETTAVGWGVPISGPCAVFEFDDNGIFWDNPFPDMGTLLESGGPDIWRGLGISDKGRAVGTVETSAAYWNTVSAQPLDIGSLLNDPTVAQRINNIDPADGLVSVAGWQSVGGLQEAVLWDCSINCTDPLNNNWVATVLNEALMPDCTNWNIRQAFDVNDDVSIVCWATKDDGLPKEHAVILEPLINCCPEDLDRDGDVDFDDLDTLLAAVGICNECGRCISDLDCNGVVDRFDERILLLKIVGPTTCGGGPCVPAAQQAAGIMGFDSGEQLANWIADASQPQAVGAGYVFSILGRALLDQ